MVFCIPSQAYKKLITSLSSFQQECFFEQMDPGSQVVAMKISFRDNANDTQLSTMTAISKKLDELGYQYQQFVESE